MNDRPLPPDGRPIHRGVPPARPLEEKKLAPFPRFQRAHLSFLGAVGPPTMMRKHLRRTFLTLRLLCEKAAVWGAGGGLGLEWGPVQQGPPPRRALAFTGARGKEKMKKREQCEWEPSKSTETFTERRSAGCNPSPSPCCPACCTTRTRRASSSESPSGCGAA